MTSTQPVPPNEIGPMREWMTGRNYVSIAQLKSSVCRTNVRDPEAYDRANYYQVLHSMWG